MRTVYLVAVAFCILSVLTSEALTATNSPSANADVKTPSSKPNVDDLLRKVKANYSQIADISYTFIRKHYSDDSVSPEELAKMGEKVVLRQKGPYKMRWENQSTHAVTIVKENAVGVIDEKGQLTPMFTATGDDASAEANKDSVLYWDVDRFKARHDFVEAVSPAANRTGSYTFKAKVKKGVPLPYDSLICEVDFQRGIVTKIEYFQEGELQHRFEQSAPIEIKPGIWFHKKASSIMPSGGGWNFRDDEEILPETIQINTGKIPDSLFEF